MGMVTASATSVKLTNCRKKETHDSSNVGGYAKSPVPEWPHENDRVKMTAELDVTQPHENDVAAGTADQKPKKRVLDHAVFMPQNFIYNV